MGIILNAPHFRRVVNLKYPLVQNLHQLLQGVVGGEGLCH